MQPFASVSRCRSGSFAVVMALMLLPLLGAVGLGLDTLRLHRVQQRLQVAVDAASEVYQRPSADKNISREMLAKTFFEQNIKAGGVQDFELKSFKLTPKGHGSVSLFAQAEVPLYLMSLLGRERALVSAEATTRPITSSLEVALVIDVGGPMASVFDDDASHQKVTWLEATQKGALSFLRAFYPDGKSRPSVYVSIVPYTQVVNVGLASRPWASGFEALRGGAWGGCVRERSNLAWLEEAPVGTGDQASFPIYFVAEDSTAIEGQMKHRFIAGQPPVHGAGQNSGCGPEVLPLSSDPRKFWDKITTLTPAVLLAPRGDSKPYDNTPSVGYGASLASEGLVWGWRTLSPSWRGLWAGLTGAMPFPYGVDHPKAIVLATSGDTSLTDFDSALGRLTGNPDDNLLGAKKLPEAVEKFEARMRSTCEKLTQQDVRLYVLQMGSNGGPVGRIFKRCLAQSGHQNRYVSAESAAEVEEAFITFYRDLAPFVPQK